MTGSLQGAGLLHDYRGALASGLAAPRDLLLWISRLAMDLPEVTELDLNPVLVQPDSVFIVEARVKVMPCEPRDPCLRKLR